ncbi:hypothetical protein Tsubulata_046597 [Turnera subulata]|uniref:AAA+ ATPase domain-containing protein n=1 Tax=Turnera subulata TaxID=218843 RepID=A0A9Q0GH54_9ROSI|nr:hypothetical protein Tsubulata_046597 [Turnera subulata]
MFCDPSFACAPVGLELTLQQVVRFIEYPLKYKRNVDDLKEKVGDLKREHDRLQRQVEVERRNLNTIEPGVGEWLSEVEQTIQKLEGELAVGEEKANKKFFIGLCPNVKARYQLGRKAEKEADAVDRLHKRRDQFRMIAYEAPLVDSFSFRGGYEAFESRVAAFKEIMDALVDSDNFSIVGVCGMPGIGKTSLVKEVARKARVEKLFDMVVFAALAPNQSKESVQKNIQNSIAEKLGLTLGETSSEERRASRLRERLKQEKKILIVIDDLWDALDLEAVGIPSQNDHNGCKILLTSRNRNLLSREMNCPKLISIDDLPEYEAWDLFRKIAGDTSPNPELHRVAIKVAKKCGGLPLAISVVAKSLKDETKVSKWKDTLRRFRKPSLRNFTGVAAGVYAPLKLSIDRLPSEEKSIFLLCCRLGYWVHFVDLLKYGMGLSKLPGGPTVEAARDRLESILDHLKADSLLLETHVQEIFTMSVPLRIVGQSIASREGAVLVMDEEDELKEWPDKEKLKKLIAIRLSCSINVLPEELECPKLQFLHISLTDPHLKIPDNIFRKMQKLKVLDLTRFSLLSLPSSLVSLKSLRTLCLDQSKLQDLSIIGELKNLEILSFRGSMFKHFPRELGQLTKLKLLDLTDCHELSVIPPKVISKLSRLEELLMQNSFDGWEIEGRNAASLVELNHLLCLTNLEIRIRDTRTMPMGFPAQKLQRYRILIGSSWDWDGSFETSKMLKLKLDTDIRNNDSYGIQMLIKTAEALYLDDVKGAENLLYGLDKEGFPLLKHLRLQNHPEIKYIVNKVDRASANIAFPVLETLFLHNLVSLEKIFQGKFMAQLFGKLQTLEVSDCTKLKHLFSLPLVKGLVKLQSIKVTSCNNMVGIVAESEELAGENGEAGMIEFPQLRSISLSSLPRLKNFCSKVKGSLATASHPQEITEEECLTSIRASLFNDKAVFPNLEELSLESIHIEMLWDGQPSKSALCFQNLTKLVVKDCGLKYLFSSSMVKSLERLEYLEVSECELMEEIIVVGGLPKEENIYAMVFPKLEFLELCDLPKLTQFSSTGYPVECPLLDQLKISACPKLKTFISSFTSGSTTNNHKPPELKIEDDYDNVIQPLFDEKVKFPRLTHMEITRMDSLEMVWHPRLAEGSFCEMKVMRIDQCKMLLHAFPSALKRRFQKLDALVISNCYALEEVFQFHGSGNLEFPSLGVISIENCPNMKPLCSLFLRDQEPEVVDMPTAPHLNNEVAQVAFPKLTALGVDWNHIREISHSQSWAEIYGKITHLRLRHFPDDYVVFPFNFLQRFINLETLAVTDASFQEIFSNEQGNQEEMFIEVLTKLKTLSLNKMSKLQCLFKGDSDSHQCPLFQNLETLHLFQCRQLKSLFPSSVSFRNLTDLRVSTCHGLQYLMNCSAANCLVELKRMVILNCEMIQEIVATEEKEAELEVVFHKLETLTLEMLPSLACFHSRKCSLIFPSLCGVLVKECPKMTIFSAGQIGTPMLEAVDLTEEGDTWLWEGNLNDTIRELFTLTGQDAVEPKMPSLSQQLASALDNSEADEIGKHGPLEDPTYAVFLRTNNQDTSSDLPNVIETSQNLVLPGSLVGNNGNVLEFPAACAEQTIGVQSSSSEPEIPEQTSSCHEDSGPSSNTKSNNNFSCTCTPAEQASTPMTLASPTRTIYSDKLLLEADTKHMTETSSAPITQDRGKEDGEKNPWHRHRLLELCSQNPSTMTRQALQELQSVTRSLATHPHGILEAELLSKLHELLTALNLEDDCFITNAPVENTISFPLAQTLEVASSSRSILSESTFIALNGSSTAGALLEIFEREGVHIQSPPDQVASLPGDNPDLEVDIHQALADLAELRARYPQDVPFLASPPLLDPSDPAMENALASFFSFLGFGPHAMLSYEKIKRVRVACETLITSLSITNQAVRNAAQQLLDLIEVNAAEYKESFQQIENCMVILQSVQAHMRTATQQIGVVRSHLDRVDVLQTDLANLRGRGDGLREELAALEAQIAAKDGELRREKTAYLRADVILRQADEGVTSFGSMNPPPEDMLPRAQERVAAIEKHFNRIRADVIRDAP